MTAWSVEENFSFAKIYNTGNLFGNTMVGLYFGYIFAVDLIVIITFIFFGLLHMNANKLWLESLWFVFIFFQNNTTLG